MNKPSDMVKDGQTLMVKLMGFDDRGKGRRQPNATTSLPRTSVLCYVLGMLADIETEFPPGEVTFEMSNLSPRETGLDFVVFVSPKMASHAARIKVTQPPWGSRPAAVYTLSPFGFAAGDTWLSKHQEDQLRLWVAANLAPLLAYWEGDILYDQDLRAALVPLAGSR